MFEWPNLRVRMQEYVFGTAAKATGTRIINLVLGKLSIQKMRHNMNYGNVFSLLLVAFMFIYFIFVFLGLIYMFYLTKCDSVADRVCLGQLTHNLINRSSDMHQSDL